MDSAPGFHEDPDLTILRRRAVQAPHGSPSPGIL